ncbi:MAG: type II toxin-antitoxin system RelE/ParE family toxin, partial [Nostoc sp.]
VSYGTRETEAFHHGERVKAFDGIRRQAEAKLDRLDVADSLMEVGLLPGNRLEVLRGERKGQYSIRINDQWRICFRWDAEKNGFADIEIVDYH